MDLKRIASMITTDIDCAVVRNADQRHRNHLGASEIGDECSRKLWYKFRWVHNQKFNGRMLRLFDRGHREEDTFIKLLLDAGWAVFAADLSTGKQYRFSALWGHFGGSMDGIGAPPPGSQYESLGDSILEFKTSADKYHKKLNGENVHTEQPKHEAQMHLYGASQGVKYAVYLSVSKDNDKLACEVLPINQATADALMEKARSIIFSQEPPPKLNTEPTFYKCKWCDFSQQCHYNKAADRNCRSCKLCRPGENAQWWCDKHQQYLDTEGLAVEKGCWESII